MKKTRFKLAIGASAFLAGVVVYALYKDNTTLAGQGLTGFMSIISIYVLGDSYRKSE